MRRIFALALTLVLALTLTACGGGNSNTGGSTTTPPANSGTTNPPADNSPPVTSPAEFIAKDYETGITYDQLARTPDDYKKENVKFTGKVVQVIEEKDGTTLRVATRENYDDVILVYYNSDIVSSRILDGDTITLYGISAGLHTYESTLGGKITIPLVYVVKVEQNIGGIAVDDKSSFDAESIAETLEVRQLNYNSSYATYVFLIIKNTSDFTLEIEAALETFAVDGSILSHNSRSENAVGAGQETIFKFMLDEKFADSKYEVSVVPEQYYLSITQDLTYTSSPAKNKEIITVTNNGNLAAQFVEGSVLFFKNDIVVYENSTYFTDNDYELKPGKSITKEISCYEEYDSFKIVFTGKG